MDSMSVRVATDGDASVVLDWMEAFNAFEKISWHRARGEPALRKLLGDAGLGVVGIVEVGGAAVGYFIVTWGYDLEWNGRDAYLTELFLVPEARGQGVGKFALERAEALARRHGALALHIMVRHDNLPALRLYERAGYASPPRAFLTKAFRVGAGGT